MQPARNALQDFPTEELATAPAVDARVEKKPSGGARRTAIGIALVSVAVVSLIAATPRWIRATPPAVPTGRLTINSTPAGLEALVDGATAGLTPLLVTVPTGVHKVVLRRGLEERELSVTINPGSEVTHYVDFPVAVEAPAGGTVMVTTDPPGVQVTLDGKARGQSPLVLADVAPGEHLISVATDAGASQRKVNVENGATASVVFSLPKAAGPAAGWLSVTSPFDVQVFDGADLVGAGGVSKILMTVGRHDVRLLNAALGYEELRRIDVTAGKLALLRIEPPKAAINANARPWAEVFVDGTSVGQTPIANLALPIGPHQFVFRHPQLGEQRQTVVVTAKGPNRASADLTKK